MSDDDKVKKYLYTCKRCEFNTDNKTSFGRHKLTRKHKKIDAPRIDKKMPDKCELCSYVPTSYQMYKHHKLIDHSTKENRKKDFTHYCDTCDFGTFNKRSYSVHLGSKIHQRRNE